MGIEKLEEQKQKLEAVCAQLVEYNAEYMHPMAMSLQILLQWELRHLEHSIRRKREPNNLHAPRSH